MHNLIVHIIPVWSPAAVPSPDGVLQRSREGGAGGLFPTDTKKDCYKRMNCIFIFYFHI